MKKLSLSLETLQVESFTTSTRRGARGTVEAQSFIGPTGWTYCIDCAFDTGETDDCYQETEQPTCDPRPAGTCQPQPI